MPPRPTPGLAGIAMAALILTGCSAPGPAAEQTPPPTTVSSPAPEPSPEPQTPDLTVVDTSLGSVVADSAGLTVYYYDADTAGSGVSTCSGSCLVAWPAVHPVNEDAPVLDGVTADVGVITGTDGQAQLTLNGLPLYYWQGDSAPGDVLGQAKGGVWWVVAPDGSRITG